jgi:hypothetical protein
MDRSQMVDLERYRIDALDTDRGRTLIARCRSDLAEAAICVLPGFLQKTATDAMISEAERLIPEAYRYDQPRIAYELELDANGYEDAHPTRMFHPNRYRQVLNHQIPNDSLLRALFLWPVLTEFVRRALGLDRLYTSACPHLALTMHIAYPGDSNGWHFDSNDGVVTLVLQQPDSGGEFEYAPYIRSDDDERFDAIGRLFESPGSEALRPGIEPGSLTLFNGRLSMHRVREIGSSKRPRIVAIFSYDQCPDQVFSRAYIDLIRSFPQQVPIGR